MVPALKVSLHHWLCITYWFPQHCPALLSVLPGVQALVACVPNPVTVRVHFCYADEAAGAGNIISRFLLNVYVSQHGVGATSMCAPSSGLAGGTLPGSRVKVDLWIGLFA